MISPRKIISFSLWGDDKKYTIGALRNAELALSIYPGWICRFYLGESVPLDISEELQEFSNSEIIDVSEKGDWTSTFWRFLAADHPNDIVISRDTDSRLNKREKAAVDEWLNSDKDFHIMRDHPYHATEILAGMWGCRNGILEGIEDLIDGYQKENFWQVDQNFLKEKIYPLIRDRSLVHDEFFEKKPFPTKRENREFVGEAYNHLGERNPEHYLLVQNE
jgi:protein O-GlcNAc transferase